MKAYNNGITSTPDMSKTTQIYKASKYLVTTPVFNKIYFLDSHIITIMQDDTWRYMIYESYPYG